LRGDLRELPKGDHPYKTCVILNFIYLKSFNIAVMTTFSKPMAERLFTHLQTDISGGPIGGARGAAALPDSRFVMYGALCTKW